jgi:hypothetical protein
VQAIIFRRFTDPPYSPYPSVTVRLRPIKVSSANGRRRPCK